VPTVPSAVRDAARYTLEKQQHQPPIVKQCINEARQERKQNVQQTYLDDVQTEGECERNGIAWNFAINSWRRDAMLFIRAISPFLWMDGWLQIATGACLLVFLFPCVISSTYVLLARNAGSQMQSPTYVPSLIR